ncbi:MAG: DNA gyrase subunit A [Desulfitobacteriia bacterium]|jgi:DNA gyrase subunit A
MSMELFNGKILPIEISEELKKSFIDYSMSVIVSRALPDVRDGLKPVHRRILYALHDLGMTPNKSYSKAARLVGDCMGKFHPHGDSSIYDAVVRMAQDFSSRYPLIDGHGNFGSLDGDSAAAMRYTELRMAPLAIYMLADIEKDTVDFVPNYDEKEKEPAVLPAKVPNLLINGSSGIAVGMATNIPPHNLGEIIDGVIFILDSEDRGEEDNITLKNLMKFIKGPDFPTGGLIMGKEGIIDAYTTGKGSVKIRAKVNIETIERSGKAQLVVTEIPYMVNKGRLLEKIAELVHEKKVEGITDLRDESTRKGVRVVIELRKDVNPQIILNQLYRHTQLEDTFGINMLALVDGSPRVLNLKEMLEYFILHQKEVIIRRSKFELKKAEDDAHIVEGLRRALDFIDEVIEIIRSSKDDETARNSLIERFEFSERQAQAILDMRLRRLTGLERTKLDEQYQKLLDEIAYLRAVLASDTMVRGIIRTELLEIKEKFADERRSKITVDATKMEIEDLIAEEDVVITVTHRGYIKRLPLTTYRNQKRGGRGVSGMTTLENDFVDSLFIASTHHYILVFTSKGKVYRLRAYEIPEASRTAKGTAIVNLLNLSADEQVTATIAVKEFSENLSLLTVTKMGMVKRTMLNHYDSQRRDGLIALSLVENDELIGVRLTKENSDVLIATRYGQVIRFSAEEVRAMGRTAHGVRGIKLDKGDYVISMDVIDGSDSDWELLTVTENGFAKRSKLEEFRKQRRGGKGVIGHRVNSKTGLLVGIKVVSAEEDLMVITDEGIVIRQEVNGISVQGRAAQGVTVMRTGESKVAAIAKVINKEEDE